MEESASKFRARHEELKSNVSSSKLIVNTHIEDSRAVQRNIVTTQRIYLQDRNAFPGGMTEKLNTTEMVQRANELVDDIRAGLQPEVKFQSLVRLGGKSNKT